MNPADESTECELIEGRGAVDISAEVDGAAVVLCLSPDDGTQDVGVMLSPYQARELAEHLFRLSFDTR